MTLPKLTVDKSDRYVSKDDHSHSEQTPPISKERSKNAFNNKISQKNK